MGWCLPSNTTTVSEKPSDEEMVEADAVVAEPETVEVAEIEAELAVALIVGVEALITPTKVRVPLVCVIVVRPPACPPAAAFAGTMVRVLVLTGPLTAGYCVGSRRERYPIPLFALFAVIVSSVEAGTANPKTLVKLPVALV